MRNREILFIVRMRNQARAALNSLGNDLKNTAKNAKVAGDSVARVNNVVKQSGNAFQQGARGAGSFATGLRRITSLLGPLAAGLSIGAVINQTVRATGQFETSLSRIVGLVGIAEEDVKGFGVEILKLGGAVAKAPTELADAMFFITSAGQRGQKALDTLTASAKASAGGLGDTKTVADAVTSALNAYATSNLKASEVTDILTATVREGKLEAAGLARSIGQVLPVAENAGVSLNEVGATIASLTQVGLPASSAIAGLRGVLSALSRQSAEAKPILKIVGTSFEEIKKNIKEKGLLAALTDLRARLGDNDAALTKVFGDVEAVNTVLALTGANSEKVTGIFRRMNNVVGATDVAFNAAAKTAEFKFNAAMAKMQSVLIRIGGTVLPPVVSAITFLADNMDLVGKAALSVAILFGGRLAVGALAAGKAMLGLGVATAGTTTAMRILGGVMKALKIILIFEAVDGLVNLIKQFNKETADGVTTWTLFGAAGRAVLTTFTEALSRVLNGLGALGKAFVSLLKGNLNEARAGAVAGAIKLASVTGVSFNEKLREEMSKIALTVRQGLDDAEDGIDADTFFNGVVNEQAAAQAGNRAGAAAGKATSNAFLAAINQFGTLEKFTGALDQLVTKFAPEIGRTKELNDALRLLEVAGKASVEQLRTLGITKKQLADITKRVIEAQKQETGEVQKAIEVANRRIQVAGLDKNARDVEAKVLEVVAAAKAKDQRLDKKGVNLLRERLELARQTEARETLGTGIQDTIRGLQQQAQLLGADEATRRRTLAVEQLKNQARNLGIKDTRIELFLLNEELDALERAEQTFRGDAFGGVRDGLKKFVDEAKNLRGQFDQFTTSTLNKATDALTEFINTGKFNFRDFANSAIQELQRIASQRIIAEIAAAFSSGGNGGGGGGGDSGAGFAQFAGTIAAAFASSGGTVGRNAGHGRFGMVPASAFANAQRFQGGGTVRPRGTDSVPILATPGEVILTEDQAGFLSRALEGRNVGGLTPSPGVRQPLGGGLDARGVSNSVTVVMNITTPDVGGFRRSQQQVGAETAGSINRALRRNG